MAVAKEKIFIDTHILLWLASGYAKKLSAAAKKAINTEIIFISPMSILELHYLYEINRIPLPPDEILKKLREFLEIEISESGFTELCKTAGKMSWTRDSFDRLIVADAALHKGKLITADEKILQHYNRAVW